MQVVEIEGGYVITLDGNYTVSINQGSTAEISGAYIIAINNAKGDTGATGATGPAGANGTNGVDGIDGNDGADGIDGYTPWIGTPVTGIYYPVIGIRSALAPSTLAAGTNRLDLAPVIFNRTLTPAAIGLQVTASTLGTGAQIVIYSSNADGYPDALLWAGSAFTLGASAAYYEATNSIPTFTKGVIYWFGTICSGNPTLRTTALGNAIQIGGIGTTGTTANYGTVIRRTSGVAISSLPNPFNFVSSEITNNVTPPMILFRF